MCQSGMSECLYGASGTGFCTSNGGSAPSSPSRNGPGSSDPTSGSSGTGDSPADAGFQPYSGTGSGADSSGKITANLASAPAAETLQVIMAKREGEV